MDYNQIFLEQQRFYYSQQTKSLSFRREMLLKLKNLLQENTALLNKAIFDDFGKSEIETHTTELGFVYRQIDYYLQHLEELAAPKRVKTGIESLPGSSFICSDPLGCTLIIGAWNYPYQLCLAPAVAALAAGNTCIIKPSELPANTMRAMSGIINDAFARSYLFVAEGGVTETTALLQLPFNKIFFTGSPRVGRIVYEAAAKQLIPVTLELGGKSPAIVTSHADLKVAARRIVWGKFINAGQTCIAPDYVLVHESVKDRFLELVISSITQADYSPEAEHYVRIIDERNYKRIVSMIDRDKLVYGGQTDESKRYIGPTVLDGVTRKDAVMQEEIFGPVLPILTFSNFEQAINELTEMEKPLAAYLFSTDKKEKDIFSTRLSFGGGCINDTLMHIINEQLPFGGVGNSGIGSYHGEWGFQAFSHQKAVVEKGVWGEPDIKYPPYTSLKKKLMKWLM
jgi:aldehyde dehydrogenase (NAD+)